MSRNGRKFFGTLLGTAGAASFAPGPAPTGFHWEFVTADGQRVTASTSKSAAEPVVALVGN
jgi:hypothetical protein